MPLPSPPSTRLSRVAPHDACFITSVSGTPYLAKMPFSLATNSGAASVSAMKPSLAPLTSGPAPCAKAPDGNCACAAPSRAAVPALALRNDRRLMLLVRRSLVIVSLPSLVWFPWLTHPARVDFSQQKKPLPEAAVPPQDSGFASWPVVGPHAHARASTCGRALFKRRASAAPSELSEINQFDIAKEVLKMQCVHPTQMHCSA